MKNIKVMDGTLIFIIASVLLTGGLAVNAHISEKRKEKDLNDKTEEIINIQKELNKSGEETRLRQADLIDEQKKNIILSQRILEFQEKLDENTTKLSEITESVEAITLSNNKISSLIANEQRAKGKLELKIEERDMYNFNVGSNGLGITRVSLENSYDFFRQTPFAPLPFSLTKLDDNLLVNADLYDRYGNLIVQIIDNEWSLNKNNTYSINFDESGLEVIDNFGRIIFQVTIVDDVFNITMLVYNTNSITLVSPEFSLIRSYNANDLSEHLLYFAHPINRVFKHEGDSYIGKRLIK